MAFWNINSGAAITSYDSQGLPVGVNNDAGTIRRGGTIASTRFESKGFDVGSFITIVSGVNGITGAKPSQPFNDDDYVIRNYNLSIASNSAAKNKSINQLAVLETKLYKTAIRNGQWDIYDGQFSPAVTVVNSGVWDIAAGVDTSATVATSGTDDAANPTRLVPGEIVYTHGSGAQPTTDAYKTKELW